MYILQNCLIFDNHKIIVLAIKLVLTIFHKYTSVMHCFFFQISSKFVIKNSEYDQEISQPQTADKSMTS